MYDVFTYFMQYYNIHTFPEVISNFSAGMKLPFSFLLSSFDGVTALADRSFFEYVVVLIAFAGCLTLDLRIFFLAGAMVFLSFDGLRFGYEYLTEA